MSYVPPSLRKVGRASSLASPTIAIPQPLAAPAAIAAQRLALCAACENNSAGNCRLFGCCNKDLARTITLALQQCPAGRWPRWLPHH